MVLNFDHSIIVCRMNRNFCRVDWDCQRSFGCITSDFGPGETKPIKDAFEFGRQRFCFAVRPCRASCVGHETAQLRYKRVQNHGQQSIGFKIKAGDLPFQTY